MKRNTYAGLVVLLFVLGAASITSSISALEFRSYLHWGFVIQPGCVDAFGHRYQDREYFHVGPLALKISAKG